MHELAPKAPLFLEKRHDSDLETEQQTKIDFLQTENNIGQLYRQSKGCLGRNAKRTCALTSCTLSTDICAQ